jgi:hypothetical protein
MTNDQPALSLGIDDFTYADLHDPVRLRDLHTRSAATSLPPIRRSGRRGMPTARIPTRRARRRALGPHRPDGAASQSLPRRLFGVDEPRRRAQSTRTLDALFRFKADFVRKRRLPLVKGGVRVALDPADADVVRALARRSWPTAITSWRSRWPVCAARSRVEVRADGTEERRRRDAQAMR